MKEDQSGYKTEEQLKAEAKKQAEQRARLRAAKKESPTRKKAENYWYHYKWHTIAGVIALAILGMIFKDLLRPKPDATIILATAGFVSEEAQQALTDALEELAEDYNGDGRVLIQLNVVQLPGSGGDDGIGAEMDYAGQMKLATVLAANTDPVYLMDDAIYLHINGIAEDGEAEQTDVFDPLSLPGAEGDRLPVEATVLGGMEELEELRELGFYFRGTKDKEVPYEDYCYGLLEALAG